MAFYSDTRVTISILLSIVVFIVVTGAFGFWAGVFAVFLTHAVLIPKVLWNFVLDRTRELGKAFRDED